LLLLALGALLHLAGTFFYLEWVEAAALLPSLAGLALLLGGWGCLHWAAPSIAFLVFMVPLPYTLKTTLAAPLQRIATLASTFALQTLGYPALAEGNVILLDDVRIGVVEACSGLTMLVTFFALSTAVAVFLRRWLDRTVVVASAVVIAVLMNVVRITVTGVLHQVAGEAIAQAVFHDWAGWFMMPLALGCLAFVLWFLSCLLVEPPKERALVGEVLGLPPTPPRASRPAPVTV
jgi:exosortase